MDGLTPLARLILMAMRWALLFCAGCLALFIAIAAWQMWGSVLVYRDYAFLAVLGFLLIGCLWLARSIARELQRGNN